MTGLILAALLGIQDAEAHERHIHAQKRYQHSHQRMQRPTAPPPRLNHRWVWVPGKWQIRMGRSVWISGYWDLRPRKSHSRRCSHGR